MQDAAEMALASVADGTPVDGMATFATLGADGRHPQNAERDLHRWLRNLHGTNIEAYPVSIKLQTKAEVDPIDVVVPVILPSDMLYHLHRHDQWEASVVGQTGDDGLREFWTNAATQPWGRNHPATKLPDLGKTVPIYWHCDGAEFRTNAELMVWSWSSAMTRGDTMRTKFLFAAIPAEFFPSKALKRLVHKELTKVIAWSCEALLAGRFHLKGFYGEPFTGWRRSMAGRVIAHLYRAAYCGWKGDWKARREAHFFKQHYNATF